MEMYVISLDGGGHGVDHRSTDGLHGEHGHSKNLHGGMAYSMPGIHDVIFNPPATIIRWDDGVKTVVKDESMHGGIEISDDGKRIWYLTDGPDGSMRKTGADYVEWKRDGFMHCMLKRIRGNGYIDEMAEWCG